MFNPPKTAAVFMATVVGVIFLMTSEMSFFGYGTDLVIKGVSKTHQMIRNLPRNLLTDSDNSIDALDQREQRRQTLLNTCKLRIHDPLEGGMAEIVDIMKDPIRNCNQSFVSMTDMKDGVVTIQDDAKGRADKCVARCIHFKSEWKVTEGEWFPIVNKTFECDFVEAICTVKEDVVDIRIHSQIWEEKGNSSDSEDTVKERRDDKPFKPDVFIILIDSVASTQARRSLDRTLKFMESNMSAVNFHYLNKVGVNSRPNGYAMTLGWRIEQSDRSVTGGSHLNATYTYPQVCHTYRDNDSVIYREYMKKGYKTLHAEDFNGNLFVWPNCRGFASQPTTHYWRPFVLEWYNAKVSSYMSGNNCFEPYSMMLDYSEKFINAYSDDPKFLLYWSAKLSHDNPDMLFHTDTHFEEFFKRNQERMKNAFVFFMGDHGPNLGKTRKTVLGQYEAKNPFLAIAVPERLRSNEELMANLWTNSEKLLTPYDVHATLVDILEFAPKSDFESWKHIPIIEPNVNNATSILRALGPFSERNCNNIPTDSSYCLCHFEMEEVKNYEVQEMFGHYFVDYINNMLSEHNVTDKCDHIFLSKVISLKGFTPTNETDLYEVKFEVGPSEGQYRASALYNSPGNILKREGSLQRINSYGKQGDCVNDLAFLKPFCHCKGS